MQLKTLCFHTLTAHGHKLFQRKPFTHSVVFNTGWGNTDFMSSLPRMLMPPIQGRGSKDERVRNPAVLGLRLTNFSYCMTANNSFFLVLLCLLSSCNSTDLPSWWHTWLNKNLFLNTPVSCQTPTGWIFKLTRTETHREAGLLLWHGQIPSEQPKIIDPKILFPSLSLLIHVD